MSLNVKVVNITVKYGYAGCNHGWTATLHWQDDKFAEKGCVEGEIRTRYFEDTITEAINYVVEVAKQFNIPFSDEMGLFYEDDGENIDAPPPADWKSLLYKEAQKRGWQTYISAE
ncbi:MAG: hypothetical protein AB7V60_04415 [Candidatus Caldatribacteriota bacterium]